MQVIPFSVYDFFGYLGSGFILLAAVDYSFLGGTHLASSPTLPLTLLWLVVAYVLGHVVGSTASYVFERTVVRGRLGSPAELLFRDQQMTKRSVFTGYYQTLPRESQRRVLDRARDDASITAPGEALFLHCQAVVRRDPTMYARLSIFQNVTAFCRNTSMSLLLAVPVLLVGAIESADWTSTVPKLWWALVALASSIVLFLRFVKLFRHYAVEVFGSYPDVR